MEIPVHCLPYGLMRIQSSMFPTSVLTLGNFFFSFFFSRSVGEWGPKMALVFLSYFFTLIPSCVFIVSFLHSLLITCLFVIGGVECFDVFCKLCKRLHTLCSTRERILHRRHLSVYYYKNKFSDSVLGHAITIIISH